MCTAISWKNYFGRNLDLEYNYNEQVTITPRDYEFNFSKRHYAIIGMAYIQNNYPLYYDAINEKGVGAAGLNFPGNAHYNKICKNKTNVASFEFIPYILSQCASVAEAKELINNANITSADFSSQLPSSPLHWIISDTESSVVVESTKGHLSIFENLIGVLTNNPTFDVQLFNLNNYIYLSNSEPINNFIESLNIYSRGMGGLGLPGDLSSQSRFVKAAFTKFYSVSEEDDVSQFFHILSSVEQQRGCVKVGNSYEITVYSSCCNLKEGLYYYKTYDNSQITCVNMHKENLNSSNLISYPLCKKQNIFYQN